MITHLFRLWVLRYHSTLLQHVSMFGPSLRFWFSVWVINFRIIWTYCNTSPKGEVLRGSVTLAALLFKPLCQLPCEHTNPHSRHCQCKTLFSLKPQRSSFAPPLHFFFLLWTQSVSERINKHDCFTKTHTHTHTHRSWLGQASCLQGSGFATHRCLRLVIIIASQNAQYLYISFVLHLS